MLYDAIIIGGGAAGLFSAFQAGKRGKRVLVLEHNAEVGRKILISGGGRCNFTNIYTRPENFISNNPHFCKSALAGYGPQDLVDLVRQHRIAFYEKKLGQLFCRESSRQIVDMLLKECGRARVDVRTACTVNGVDRSDRDGDGKGQARFTVRTNGGAFDGKSLVVACGGLSFPKIGASDLGFRIARQFGLKIIPTRPSLVALAAKGLDFKRLAGISLDAVVTTGKHSFRENILFTHRGISGPAILQISNYWKRSEPITIDLLPDTNAAERLAERCGSRQTLANFLGELLPQRFADIFTERTFANKPIYQFNEREIVGIGETLNAWQVSFDETEGYDRAEVTLGGVSTDELSSKTMEAKRVAGLYFIGEVVDVTGWLGGYNFQWAWSSAFAAARSL